MRRSNLVAFVLGMAVATATVAVARPSKKFKKLDVFARVLSYVENNYVEEVDEQSLVYGAVKGMVDTLDPHSSFMTPKEFESLRADTDGEFGGVGIEIEDEDGVLIVIRPLPRSPAAKAGLEAGDRIVAVDGKATRGRPRAETAGRLRGRPGTRVVVDVLREGWTAPKRFTLVREVIHVEAVDVELLASGIGYIRIRQFQERTDQEVVSALKSLEKRAGGKLKGLILDLRGNPGGLFDQSVRVADLFLPEGVIVSTVGRGGRKLEEETARRSGTWLGFPIVCLVNGQSASAAEILAGALQDHNRAVILGTRSFGKGSVQSVIQLDDGSGLKLTVARYLTPSGRSIQEKGIKPDILVEQIDPEALEQAKVKDDGKRERDLEGHLKGHPDRSGPRQDSKSPDLLDRDYQLRTAFQTILSWDRFGRQGSGDSSR